MYIAVYRLVRNHELEGGWVGEQGSNHLHTGSITDISGIFHRKDVSESHHTRPDFQGAHGGKNERRERAI